jgi:ATP-binding cassette subfamily B protein
VTIFHQICILWAHSTKGLKHQYYLAVTIITISAFLEVINLGLVYPFLSILISPSKVFDIYLKYQINTIFTINDADDLILSLSIFLFISTIFSGMIRLYAHWYQISISFKTGNQLATLIFNSILKKEFIFFKMNNTAELTALITQKVNTVVGQIIQPALSLISSLTLFFVIFLGVLFINPRVTLAVTFFLLLVYFIFIYFFKVKIKALSFESANQQVSVFKVVEEGLGGIRDVIIDKLQISFTTEFEKIDSKARISEARIQILSTSPRYVVESVSMLCLIGFSYMLLKTSDEGAFTAVPVLGLFALVAQRLLPAIQSIYSSWTLISGGRASLTRVIEILSQSDEIDRSSKNVSKLNYVNNISLDNVKYSYPDGSQIIKGISVSFKKGEHVGIIGQSGGGKSTLIDLIMGLLQPSSGYLVVDGVVIDQNNLTQWQTKVAHVPQSVYISNSTILENIAFGVPFDSIDLSRAKIAAQKACLSDVIEGLPLGYMTVAGDRGGLLSGGQRQRIGIARAFYKNADLIILDEATNALDEELESDLLEKILISNKNTTVIMVTHKLSVLRYCDRYIEVSSGLIKASGKISDIIEKNDNR